MMGEKDDAMATDEQDAITRAEDGEEIITINGASVALGVPYFKVQEWAKTGKLGQAYESAGYRFKRYSWKKAQEVAAWRAEKAS